MKNSALLERILDYAKKLGSGKSVTVEQYLVSIIDTVTGKADVGIEDAERAKLKHILEERLQSADPGFEKARKTLIEYLGSDSYGAFSSSLYLQQMELKAGQDAAKNGSSEIVPSELLEAILKEPNGFVKDRLLAKKAEPEPEEDDSGDEDRDDGSRPDIPDMRESADRTMKSEKKDGEESREEPAEEPEKEAESEKDPLLEIEELTCRVRELRDNLSSVVFGQGNAINLFATGYFQYKLNEDAPTDSNRPCGTFLFAGPPGVGKTFLVKNVVRFLKAEDRFKRFDMSEYADSQSFMDLIGYDDNYKRPKEGLLTSFVKENPECVLLFDEIEKANMTTIQLFLQILDEGILTDSKTKKAVSFKKALIFFTTNAGKKIYETPDAYDFSGVSRKVILKAIEREVSPVTGRPVFPAAICSRFASGNVVMFNHLSAAAHCRIVEKEILRKSAAFEGRYRAKIEFDRDVFSSILFAEGALADARMLRGRAESFFDQEMFGLLRFLSSEDHAGKISDLKTIRFEVDLPEEGEIGNLFRNRDKYRIPVFSTAGAAKRCAEKYPDADSIAVDSLDSLKKTMSSTDSVFVMVDLLAAGGESRKYLDIEDYESSARDAFKYLREKYADVQLFILEEEGKKLTSEEMMSLVQDGARGAISLDAGFGEEVARVCDEIYQQNAMKTLGCANKLLCFETGQQVSEDGQTAAVRLFDFSLTTAVDSNDTENIMSGVSRPNVSFDDVIGAESAKAELKFFIEYLKDPKSFAESGLKAPRGVLLYGPPGTGKTMLAKAVASESGVTFIATEGNRFLKRFVGEGKDDLHELFAAARRYAPSILFIDEFEAIAQERRGGDQPWAKGEDVLTALLTEMDGFNTDIKRPVFVLAATNFDIEPGSGKSLDRALLRRFDSKIHVDLPNKDERIRFMKLKRSANPAFCVSDEKIENVAVRATGMSLSDLDSIIELSYRTAIRMSGRKVTDDVFDEAFETYTGGEKKNWNASTLQRTARHEAGHAYLSWQAGKTPQYVTVVARGSHGGYMLHADEDRQIYTKQDLLGRIRTALGGRAAETVFYGEQDGISTGASSDLASATSVAQQIICTYGMDDEFGLAVIDQRAAGEGELSLAVRDAVNGILDAEMKEAVRIIGEQRAAVDALASRLMSDNQLSGTEIDEIFRRTTV
ncbi:MAG: AAA family ATPase [Clostridia bacterium]|nr:AAA family ATPase [Clostridia bacterium]